MDAFVLKRDDPEGGGEEVYSKPVRAGRRTYFFDVKATRNDDYFLTITESRKKQGADGNFFFDKHKIYLYKEDFAKFAEGLQEVVDFIKERKPEFFIEHTGSSPFSIGSLDEEFDRL
ncbi:MAG: PUR family DNA/RNA-binding protein [Rikenellaceae bacterium]|nr:PUR family DNA/RNA-binding protein [Rikenellaceae bacterium]